MDETLRRREEGAGPARRNNAVMASILKCESAAGSAARMSRAAAVAFEEEAACLAHAAQVLRDEGFQQ